MRQTNPKKNIFFRLPKFNGNEISAHTKFQKFSDIQSYTKSICQQKTNRIEPLCILNRRMGKF